LVVCSCGFRTSDEWFRSKRVILLDFILDERLIQELRLEENGRPWLKRVNVGSLTLQIELGHSLSYQIHFPVSLVNCYFVSLNCKGFLSLSHLLPLQNGVTD
jgi:hypothetical protein